MTTQETTSTSDATRNFFDTLRGSILSSIPALSALVFIVVAVKVFRASRMEITTTVAIVSTADVVALLKGVILTLLPGFLAGLTAASIWWWAGVLPARLDGNDARQAAARGLLSAQAVLAWALIVMAFFTIWWPVFLVLLTPVLSATGALLAQTLPRRPVKASRRRLEISAAAAVAVLLVLLVVKAAAGISWPAFLVLLVAVVVLVEALLFGWWPTTAAIPLGRMLKIFGLAAAAVFIGLLALAPTVWLPLRKITVTGEPVVLNKQALPREFAAYVLNRDEKGASLLLSSPRAVVEVGPQRIAPAMPFCVPPESRLRTLTVRASQVLGIDSDPHSPYETCPDIPQRLLGGG